jgi:hypothetical protein
MKLIRFTIGNLSPGQLQNPATEELLEQLRTGNRPQKRTDWTVEQEAGTKLYRSEDGKMGVPMQNIMSAIILAGQHVKVGKKNLSTAKATTIFDFLEFVEDFCPFKGCDEKGNVPWKPFPVKGTMHNAGSEVAVCITRPRIPKWELSFTVKYDEKRQVPQDAVVKLVETAGRKIGLCDWRPAKKGRFGRFVITKIEVLTVTEKEEKAEEVEYTTETAPKDLLELAGV